MGEALLFWPLSVLILGLGIMVVSAQSAVHSVVFLVINFLLVGRTLCDAQRGIHRGYPSFSLRRWDRCSLSVCRNACEFEKKNQNALRILGDWLDRVWFYQV